MGGGAERGVNSLPFEGRGWWLVSIRAASIVPRLEGELLRRSSPFPGAAQGGAGAGPETDRICKRDAAGDDAAGASAVAAASREADGWSKVSAAAGDRALHSGLRLPLADACR